MDLNQVTVQSGNIAEAIRFYTGLGLRLIVEAPHYARFECPVGESTFSVHLTHELKPSSGVIYFEVGNLLETVAALQARGVEFMRGPVEEPWLWHECRLADPSGNEICIYTAG